MPTNVPSVGEWSYILEQPIKWYTHTKILSQLSRTSSVVHAIIAINQALVNDAGKPSCEACFKAASRVVHLLTRGTKTLKRFLRLRKLSNDVYILK